MFAEEKTSGIFTARILFSARLYAGMVAAAAVAAVTAALVVLAAAAIAAAVASMRSSVVVPLYPSEVTECA